MKQKVVLGVGAAKCGTTWTHHYLTSNGLVLNGLVKEYHALDRICRGKMKATRKREDNRKILEEKLSRIKYRLPRWLGAGAKADELRARLKHISALIEATESLDSYIAHIQLFESEPKPFCDVTPGYHNLSEAQWTDAYSRMSEFFDVKVFFLMRDPVDRLYSQVYKPWSKAKKAIDQATELNRPIKDTWLKSVEIEPIEQFTILKSNNINYAGSIDKLRRVIPGDCLYIGFYENFFCDESVRRLCETLKVEFKKPDYTPIHASPSKPELPIELVDEAIEGFKDIYIEVSRRMKLPEAWRYRP